MAYQSIKPKGGDTGTPLSLEKRLAFFSKYHIVLENQSLIDCGCGTGQYVLELLARGADAYGVEYDTNKVAKYQREHPELANRVIQGDIEHMDFPDATFDIALLNEVLEHVPNEQAGLQEVFRLVKPGGYLVVFSPNRLFPFESHGLAWKKSGKKISIYTPFIPWIPLKFGEQFFDYWARNYWPGELQNLIRGAGFQIRHTDFLWQTFENISRRQTQSVQLFRPYLCALATTLEQTPGIRAFGLTQFVLAQKPA